MRDILHTRRNVDDRHKRHNEHECAEMQKAIVAADQEAEHADAYGQHLRHHKDALHPADLLCDFCGKEHRKRTWDAGQDGIHELHRSTGKLCAEHAVGHALRFKKVFPRQRQRKAREKARQADDEQRAVVPQRSKVFQNTVLLLGLRIRHLFAHTIGKHGNEHAAEAERHRTDEIGRFFVRDAEIDDALTDLRKEPGNR